MPRKHIVFSGRVQAVGFRYHCSMMAKTYHLTGWVRNLDSGDVEMEVQGNSQVLEKYLEHLGKGSMFIRIDHMEINDIAEITEREFKIRQ